MSQTRTIGFIGLGVMGEPICRNLVRKSGATVIAFDLAPEPVARLRAEGAIIAGSVALLLWAVHMVQTGVQRAFGAKLRSLLGHGLRDRFRAFLVDPGRFARGARLRPNRCVENNRDAAAVKRGAPARIRQRQNEEQQKKNLRQKCPRLAKLPAARLRNRLHAGPKP